MAQLYVNSNGTIIANDGPTIQAGNRGHLYGDGVFESIRIMNGKPLNMDNHIKRLIEGAKAIKIKRVKYELGHAAKSSKPESTESPSLCIFFKQVYFEVVISYYN